MSNNTAREPGSAEAAQDTLLKGYPGAALIVDGECEVIAANEKGSSLAALLAHGAAAEIAELVHRAKSNLAIANAAVSLSGSSGNIIIDVTVFPPIADKTQLVLGRDMTMERNLRSALVESRQRYKDLVEISSDFAWEVGPDGTFAFVSPKGAMGYKAENMVGRKPGDFIIGADEFSILPFVSERPHENTEMWMRRANDTTACVIVSCLPLNTSDGEWRGARGICRDVTEDREREAALTRSRNREQLLNYIVSTIRDEVEPHNMLSAAAAATARALGGTGCRIYRLVGAKQFSIAAQYGDTQGIDSLDEHLFRLNKDAEFEVKIGKWHVIVTATHYRKSVNGAICMWVDAKSGAWDDDNRILIGDVANQLGIANEQISIHDRILKLSRTDSMTGLLNRRAFFEEELPRRLGRLKHTGQAAALFYVDLDNFKMVNDVHGHQRGDEALLYLRDLLMEHSRPGDVIVRLGGDEFAVWLDGVNHKVTIDRVNALMKASKTLQKFSGSDDRPLGVSIGIAMYDPSSGESLDNLMIRADAAMYAIKKNGKGGYGLAPPPDTTSKDMDNPGE